MRPIALAGAGAALAALLAALHTGCAGEASDPCIGTWVLDVGEYQSRLAGVASFEMERNLARDPKENPEEARRQVLDYVLQRAAEANVALTLRADRTFQVSGFVEGRMLRYRGTWQRDGERLTLGTTHDGPRRLEGGRFDRVWIYRNGTITQDPADELLPARRYVLRREGSDPQR